MTVYSEFFIMIMTLNVVTCNSIFTMKEHFITESKQRKVRNFDRKYKQSKYTSIVNVNQCCSAYRFLNEMSMFKWWLLRLASPNFSSRSGITLKSKRAFCKKIYIYLCVCFIFEYGICGGDRDFFSGDPIETYQIIWFQCPRRVIQ